jgi:hypothetical protein
LLGFLLALDRMPAGADIDLHAIGQSAGYNLPIATPATNENKARCLTGSAEN